MKAVMEGRMEGTRLLGRLRSRWQDNIKKDMQRLGLRN